MNEYEAWQTINNELDKLYGVNSHETIRATDPSTLDDLQAMVDNLSYAISIARMQVENGFK